MVKELVAVLNPKNTLKQGLAVSLYRNAFYLMVANVSTGASGLAFWLVAARFHDADTVGLASAAISAMLFLSTLGTLGLDYAIIRFLPRSANATAMINTSLTMGALAALVICGVFLAGLDLWSPVLLFVRRDVLLCSGFVLFSTAHTLYLIQTKTFVARRRAEFSLGQALCFNVVRVLLVVVLAFSFGAFGIASAWGGAAILALALGVVLFQPRLEAGYRPVPTMSGKVLNQLVRYSFTNYVSVMLWIAPGYLLPLLVANLVGPESNAYFYIAWSMANILFQVPLAVSSSLFAEGSCDERTLWQELVRSLKVTFLIVVPGVLLLCVFASRLLGWFDAEYAHHASGLLRILALSALPLSINCLYFVVERVGMKMGRVIALNAFVTGATMALSWVLLGRMGLAGAGIAWLSGQSVAALAVVLQFLVRRPWEEGRARRQLRP